MIFMTSGSPPFRRPLFMIAARDSIACTKGWVFRIRLSMVENHEYVYGADAIDRTHQLEFFIRGKISQMEHAEVAVRDDDSDRLPVFSLVHALRVRTRAIRIHLSGSRQRRFDRLACGRDNSHIDFVERNRVTPIDDCMLRAAVELWIRLRQERVGFRIGSNVRAMVDELANRNAVCQSSHPTEVIQMPMSRDQMIDPLDTGILDGSHNSSRIALRSSNVTGVHHKGLSGWRYEERRIAAFDIDHIDAQCPCRFLLRDRRHGHQEEDQFRGDE